MLAYIQGHGSVDDVDEGTGDRLTETKIAEVLGLERRNRLSRMLAYADVC